MIDLTNPESFKEQDPKNVYDSTGLFADQCEQMVSEYFDAQLYTDEHRALKNVVICGMGGSAYGAHILLSLFQGTIKKPIHLVSDYHLPGFVDENSLVILVSYSGTTEEVLSCAKEAKEKGAKISGYSSGGRLGELLKEEGYPGFSFDPKNNPSGQPRLGTGYIVMGALILLRNLDVIGFSKEDILKAISEVRASQEYIKGEAQRLANSFEQKIPVLISSGHLLGNAHILRNQLNETSKTFSYFEDLPELNHHLMEGLKFPSDKPLKALFLASSHYEDIIQKRWKLTKDVMSKNSIELDDFQPKGQSKLSDSLITLSFGGYFSLYLGLLYGEDPSLIPWVDYFKEELQKIK